MSHNLLRTRQASALEATIIALTFFVLPLLEAPKNLFSFLFILIWLWGAYGRKSGLGRGSQFDLWILMLMAVLWVSPFVSSVSAQVSLLSSAPRWSLMALFVLLSIRLDYSRSQVFWIFMALVLGCTFAVGESFYQWSLNSKEYPEFRSVGHVNHSAMYTLVVFGCCLGFMFSNERHFQFVAIVGIASVMVYFVPSRSVVSLVSILSMITIATGVYVVVRRGGIYVVIGSVLTLLFVLGLLLTPQAEPFRTELVVRITSGNFWSGRDKILNSALVVWSLNPVFGTGWGSFGLITSQDVIVEMLSVAGVEYNPQLYYHYPHGHNLWINSLVERGLVGVISVSILLFLYFKTFCSAAYRAQSVDNFCFSVSLAALLISAGFFVAGLGNTTMMNEHGHAGMAFISIAYGYLRSRGLFSS
jgi:O-antigen ligase